MANELTSAQSDTLNLIASLLIRCFWISVIIVLYWFVMLVAFDDFAYSMQSIWFDLSREQFAQTGYWFLALGKIVVTLFFLVPYLAIKHRLRSTPKSTS